MRQWVLMLTLIGAPAAACRSAEPAPPADAGPTSPPPAEPPEAPAEPVEWRAGAIADPPPDPAQVAAAPALPPSLAAHLDRIPDRWSSDTGLLIVAQMDVAALVPPDRLRDLARTVLADLRDRLPSGTECLVEIVGAVEAVTYAWIESRVAPDEGVALVEGRLDLAGLLECAAGFAGDAVGPDLRAAAAAGFVPLAEHVAVASVGPSTLAVGSTALIEAMRSGPPAAPLGRSPRFLAMRGMAGSGPITLVLAGREDDFLLQGGAAVVPEPQPALRGVFGCSNLRCTSRAVTELFDLLATLDDVRGTVPALLTAAGVSAGTIDRVSALLSAAVGGRWTTAGTELRVDVGLPPGFTPGTLVEVMLGAGPALLLL
jgi:hypothetical protein